MTARAHTPPSPSHAFDVPLDAPSIRVLDSRHRPKAVEPQLLQRIRGEFREMRGFSPTLDQAARLFHLPKDECRRVFALLLTEGFLASGTDGRYRLTHS